MMHDTITDRAMVWYACRVRKGRSGQIRTIETGGRFEAYLDRKGRTRRRRVKGTGKRVFLPQHLLERAGFDVFMPVKKVEVRKGRATGERMIVTRPVLIDWIFVGWPSDQNRWPDLLALDLVVSIFGMGGRPLQISAPKVASLMREWGGGQLSARCYQMAKGRIDAKPGDVFKVPAGPFRDFPMTVTDIDETGARGLVSLFGRDVPLEVSIADMPADRIVHEAPGGEADCLGDSLAPCACGADDAVIMPDQSTFFVYCPSCGGRACIGSQSVEIALERWNEYQAIAPRACRAALEK